MAYQTELLTLTLTGPKGRIQLDNSLTKVIGCKVNKMWWLTPTSNNHIIHFSLDSPYGFNRGMDQESRQPYMYSAIVDPRADAFCVNENPLDYIMLDEPTEVRDIKFNLRIDGVNDFDINPSYPIRVEIAFKYAK
jgi:hypothetical protein